jgi:5-methylcytosine-specific restriction protein A|tara:strand:- start:109 stop:822 length:714 start_codon:yes stop_codon:yes gene_type:complete
MVSKNPNWSRDEHIVTLEFYLRYRPSIPSKESPEISELSDFLIRLQSKVGGDIPDKFRNTNGVYMKLMNFRRFDPDYEGTGLPRGNKDEGVVWNLYSSRPDELRKISNTIRSFVASDTPIPQKDIISDDEEEGEEGQILTRTHRYRERDTKLVKRKKERFLKEHGSLFCDVCDFDFLKVYGDHGEGFIECHHTKPVSKLEVGERTKLSDLVLLCSNCHRMVHRKRPWLTVRELRELI